MKHLALAALLAASAAGSLAALACRGGARAEDAPPDRVTFLRVDRPAAALLRSGNVWDAPSAAAARPRAQRFDLLQDGSLRLHAGALLVAQLPGRILGDLHLALDGAAHGAPATVRVASLLGPLRDIATVDALGEPLLQRVRQQQLETSWPADGRAFASGAVAGDRATIWLLVAIEVPAGGEVVLRRLQLSEEVAPRPDHHSVGAESRLAIPLSGGQVRRFPLPPLPVGARVEFALAPPEGMAPFSEPIRARCRLGAMERRLELADGPIRDDEAVRGWTDVAFTVETALPAGAELEVAIEGGSGRALYVGLPAVLPRREAATLPNLILISLDTLRADRVGALGSERGLTPCLDRLAQESFRFTRCYSPANFTIPAHGSMMTGLQPLVHGAFRFGERVSIRAWPNVAEACGAAGMATAAFTGGGFVDAAFGFDRGFSRYRMLDALMTRRNPRYTRSPRRAMFEWNAAVRDAMSLDVVTDWLRGHADRRFFLFFHTYHAHDYSPEPATAQARGLPDAVPWPPPIDLPVTDFPALKRGSPQLDHYEALYDATVTEVDAAVERLLATLRQAGVLDESIVIVTADHGEGFLEHDFLFHTTGLHDEVVRVPLLIHAPGLAGRTIDAPVSLIDLAPTLCELAGLAPPPEMQGTSLLPLLRGEEPPDRPLLIQDCPQTGETHSALVLGRFKYLRWMRREGPPEAGRFVTAREALHDVVSDPLEQHDLAVAPEHAATLERARSALDRVLEEMEASAQRFATRREFGDVSSADLDAELFNLGYGR
ncbi:MAG: sulfatase [Planctomycetes bacterium]|nr:sulfatase [Planctomycetota bacterium]